MSTTIRDATVTFGAEYGALLVPIERRIAHYLQRNCYTPLIGAVTPVPLRGTTLPSLHDEVMAIKAPFHLVLTDLGEGNIMDGFLRNCIHVVSCSIFAPKITRIGSSFLRDCTSLSSFDTSGLKSVTTIADDFIGRCTSLSSFDTSGLTSVTTIGGYYLLDCTSLSSFDTSGLTSVTTIGDDYLRNCTSLSSFDTSGLTSVTTIGDYYLAGCTSLSSFDTSGLTSVTTIGDSYLGGCTSLTAQPTAKDVLEGRLGPE